MQPSGLVFLVIIAIWAAYLLQHWVLRREHLATARSVDRFSDAMRVLERRLPVPEPSLSSPQPRSYAVSPVRHSRPEVVVRRAQSLTPKVPARTSHAHPAHPGRSARRVRGVLLLACLSLVVAAPSLAAFSVLPWWSVSIAVAVLVADFAWLRHAAVAKRATRRGNAQRVRPAKPAPSATRAAPRPAARPASVVAALASDDVAEVAGPTTGSPAEADLSGWSPVPVPPPTYTLKAKAERPQPVSPEATEPATTLSSIFEGLVDEGELDGLLDRRGAAGA